MRKFHECFQSFSGLHISEFHFFLIFPNSRIFLFPIHLPTLFILFLFILQFSFISAYILTHFKWIKYLGFYQWYTYTFLTNIFSKLCRKPFSKGYSSSGSSRCHSFSLPPYTFIFIQFQKKGKICLVFSYNIQCQDDTLNYTCAEIVDFHFQICN